MAEQLSGIRQYLKDNAGLKDEDITYGNGTVYAKGRSFINATPQQQDDPTRGLVTGSTYASPTALASALSTYNNAGRGSTINQTNDTLNQRINSPLPEFKAPTPFTYDYNTDPQYQNAIKSALANAQTATNNTMVGLGSRGIANSSIAVDRANQIQQKAVGDVTTNVLPSLIQQAYARYQDQANRERQAQMDNYGVGQDQIGNLFNLGNVLNQQQQQDFANEVTTSGLTGQFRGNNTLDQRNANLNAALQVGQTTGNVLQPVDDWRNLFFQEALGRNMQGQQFDSGEEQRAITNALNERQFTAQQAERAADNARQNAGLGLQQSSQSLARERFNWERDPSNPDNLYKMSQIDKSTTPKLGAKDSADNYNLLIEDFDSEELTNTAKKNGISPKEQARMLLQQNKDYLIDSDYKSASEYINKNL